MDDMFTDIRSLIFNGFIAETIKFDEFIVTIHTLGTAEENSIIETYEHLPNEYNLMAAVDTVQRAVYFINGCKITDETKKLIYDWPRQIITKIFDIYLTMADRVRTATKLINEFIKTDESKLRWAVIKSTKTSLNSVAITGNIELESRGLSYIQQVWIFLNQQEDSVEQNKLDWNKVEYMTDTICTFVNPKAMQQVQSRKKLLQDEQAIKEKRNEIQQIEQDSKEKLMIENTADELFDALSRKQSETVLQYHDRVEKSIVKAFSEDEHDKIIREYEENEFRKQLRIKKENARRAKILHEKKMVNAIVIDVPALKGIEVGFHQVSTLGDDIIEVQETGLWIVNNVDYADVVSITSFSLLKNRDKIFKEVTGETDEETMKYIEQYLQEEEQEKSDVVKRIEVLQKTLDPNETMLDKRERIIVSNKNKFESQQQEMINQIQKEQR